MELSPSPSNLKSLKTHELIYLQSLKLGNFRPEYKSQMELYLRWLAKYDQESDEQPPLGTILCAGKKQEQIELLELDKSGIHVAEYLTVLPPKEVLQNKLHDAIVSPVTACKPPKMSHHERSRTLTTD